MIQKSSEQNIFVVVHSCRAENFGEKDLDLYDIIDITFLNRIVRLVGSQGYNERGVDIHGTTYPFLGRYIQRRISTGNPLVLT